MRWRSRSWSARTYSIARPGKSPGRGSRRSRGHAAPSGAALERAPAGRARACPCRRVAWRAQPRMRPALAAPVCGALSSWRRRLPDPLADSARLAEAHLACEARARPIARFAQLEQAGRYAASGPVAGMGHPVPAPAARWPAESPVSAGGDVPRDVPVPMLGTSSLVLLAVDVGWPRPVLVTGLARFQPGRLAQPRDRHELARPDRLRGMSPAAIERRTLRGSDRRTTAASGTVANSLPSRSASTSAPACGGRLLRGHSDLLHR